MKLKTMFSSVGLDQFKPSTRLALTQVLELINQHMSELVFEECPQDIEFQSFRHMFDQMHVGSFAGLLRSTSTFNEQPVHLRNVMGELDVQAAWVLDGGDLVSYLSHLRSNDSLSMPEIETAGRSAGLHHILFRLGFANSSLSLKGAHALLQACNNRDKNQWVVSEGSQLDLISLIGLDASLSNHSGLLSTAAQQYLAYFDGRTTAVKSESPPSLAKLLKAVVDDDKKLRGHWWDEAEFLLRVLIYNTGLQLKLAGCGTVSIIQTLSPILDAIIDRCFYQTGHENYEHQVELFRTQVWYNLFSPFPDDLAALGAAPSDLLGQPGWAQGSWNNLTLPTIKGPLAVFTDESPRTIQVSHILEGMENCGIELDLDLALQGALRDWDELPSLVSFKGSCPLLDHAYAQLTITGPESETLNFLEQFTGHIKSDALSDAAKLGLWIVKFEEARRSFLLGALVDSQDSDCPAFYLEENPEHKEAFLQYLIKFNRLEGRLVTWCGYDSRILERVDGQAGENLKASMLEIDLGL